MSLYDRLAAKSSKVVLSDGSIVDDYDANGNKKVALQGRTAADGLALTEGGNTVAQNLLYNGSTLDLERANTEETILAVAARTATFQSATKTNRNARGVILSLWINSVPGTADTIQLVVEGYDQNRGQWYGITTDTAVSSASPRQVCVYPGADGTGGSFESTVGLPLPRTWRVEVIHSGSGSFTYGVNAQYIL